MKIACAQINPTVGDISGNCGLITQCIDEAQEKNCDLIVFPELVVTGYPPEDLLFKPDFISDNLQALKVIAHNCKGISAVVGFVDFKNNQRFNSAAWIENRQIKGIYHKQVLPNYGVFDEARYFTAGTAPFTMLLKGTKIAVTICEDIWVPGPHLQRLKAAKPGLILNISGSPFHAGKLSHRQKTFKKTLAATRTPYLYCNLVGGQDELVFDGGSFAAKGNGQIAVQCPQFKAGLFVLNFDPKSKHVFSSSDPHSVHLGGVEEIHEALILGIRDYVRKCGFSKVTIGLSGGIDSALVAALATKALGPDNVVGVTMPSTYNSEETKSDAAKLAENLGIKFHSIPIQPAFDEYMRTLGAIYQNQAANLAEENLQARIRGNILMALSNKFGWLVLTTGNKSEMSTGYCTLYGDTAGGFAVLKDVLKTTVYDLARMINQNAGRELIPQTTIDRPPTAELRHNQKDEDSLGPYAELDPIIVAYVEENLPLEKILKARPGKEEHVRKIISLIDRSEYKRRQAPPGIKITPRSFGRDHRMPITNRYQVKSSS